MKTRINGVLLHLPSLTDEELESLVQMNSVKKQMIDEELTLLVTEHVRRIKAASQ